MKLVKNSIKNILELAGYRITRLTEERFDPEFCKIYSKCRNYTMTTRERMYALYKAVEYIVKFNIPGEFVECGVWKGGSCMLIAYTLKMMNSTSKKIYLYDTFTGMAEPTEKDIMIAYDTPANRIWKVRQKRDHNAWCFSPLEEVRKNMILTDYPQENTILVKGKVEETLLKIKPKPIALLRLDTDWYESTTAELHYLFPLLSEGGVLILDDYGTWKGARTAVDEYLSENKSPLLLNRIDAGGRIAVKLKKILKNDYPSP